MRHPTAPDGGLSAAVIANYLAIAGVFRRLGDRDMARWYVTRAREFRIENDR